jgi:hypothetical protein
MTVRSSETALLPLAATTSLPVLHAAVLPAAPFMLEPLPTEKTPRSVETRGPPGPIVALSANQLRAPPVA